MKRFLSVCFLFILIFTSLISNIQFALTANADTIEPTNRQEMIDGINSFFQNNIDARNTEALTLEIDGSFISTYSVIVEGSELVGYSPDEPYFSLNTPLNYYRNKAGNDYNAICFSSEINNSIIQSASILGTNLTKLTNNYTFAYGETALQKASVETFAQNTVNSVITPSMTNYQKVKALHDFVVDYSSYDTTYDNAYPYQLVITHLGICQSYAGLLWMLLDKAGFESRIVFKGVGTDEYGNENSAQGSNGVYWEPHAWNMVYLNGIWYHIDATWDDPIPSSGPPILRYNYFLKSSATMQADHSWDISAYPVANLNYDTGLGNSSGGTNPLPNSSSSSSKAVSSKKPTISVVKSSTVIIASSSSKASSEVSSEISSIFNSDISSQDISSITVNSLTSTLKTGFIKIFSSLFDFKNPITFIVFIFGIGVLGVIIVFVIIKIRNKNK